MKTASAGSLRHSKHLRTMQLCGKVARRRSVIAIPLDRREGTTIGQHLSLRREVSAQEHVCGGKQHEGRQHAWGPQYHGLDAVFGNG